jgi:hypothetical protein
MDITVKDFCEMCVEPSLQRINLYNCDTGDNVWEGFADEIPDKYEDWYISSWDCIISPSETLTLNIIESY